MQLTDESTYLIIKLLLTSNIYNHKIGQMNGATNPKSTKNYIFLRNLYF